MAKSRVEKNKSLYEELELETFELEDVSGMKKEEIVETKETKVEKVEEKQLVVPVAKKNPVTIVENDEINIDEDFVIEQPLSYTSKLSVEEILRAKLEKQQKLKDGKKGYKKTPYTSSYTPETMQKNISQDEGIDVRKEVNIHVKKNNNLAIIILVILLVLVVVAGIVAIWLIR